MKYAVIEKPFNRSVKGDAEFQGKVVSIHDTQLGAVSVYRGRGRRDLDIVKVTWTNGEQARGPRIDWSRVR